jgi:hypothetical protein
MRREGLGVLHVSKTVRRPTFYYTLNMQAENSSETLARIYQATLP